MTSTRCGLYCWAILIAAFQAVLPISAVNEPHNAALRTTIKEPKFAVPSHQSAGALATAHVADLLKFPARNPKLSGEDQKKIIAAIAQRCRTVPSVFVWGEDGRIAAALLSIVDGKDFDQSSFDEWFKALIAENNHLWKEPKID